MSGNRPLLVILGIMAAVLAWGTLHALGAFLFDLDPRKPVIVYGMVLAFLLFWATMLVFREWRRSADRRDDGTRKQGPHSDT